MFWSVPGPTVLFDAILPLYSHDLPRKYSSSSSSSVSLDGECTFTIDQVRRLYRSIFPGWTIYLWFSAQSEVPRSRPAARCSILRPASHLPLNSIQFEPLNLSFSRFSGGPRPYPSRMRGREPNCPRSMKG